ncbi:hypothetical protein ABDK00_016025 [Niabella insulamsoli]|uniref:hypothetical protein n=1 Tax=Niabella insulamsoli TaxID=3144874 RepID=UPI0031FDA712
MRKLFALLFAAVLSEAVMAQSLGDFKPKDQAYGLNKIKNKKLYIAAFSVNYQVYNEKEDFKQGGRMIGGGAYKGDAKASLSVGLEGLSEASLQKTTDMLYNDFITMLKNGGIEIITADEAGKTATYADFTQLNGGKINLAQIPGTLSTTPTGYDFYVKQVLESGKTKSGGFMGNASFVHPKLSKDLNDAIIADVGLTILFIEDKNAFDLAGANIKVKTNLRLAANESIIMTKDAKFKLKGQNDVIGVNSSVAFYSGKMGAGSPSTYIGTMGKSLSIEGVIEDKKLQSFAKNQADYIGVETAYGRYFNPDNISSKSTTVIPVDNEKYVAGAYAAGKKFLDFHTAEFLKKIK